MLKRLSIVALGALLVAVIAPAAFAVGADLNLKLVYVQSTNSVNTLVNGGTGQYPTPITNGGTIPAGMVDPTDRHRFAYLFSITGQDSDESLQGFQTQVVRSGWNTGALVYNTSAALGTYTFTNPSWNPDLDADDDPASRNLWNLNQDSGSVGDYITMRALADGNNEWYAAHHYNPGESGDYYLGRMTFSMATPSTPGVYTLTVQKDGTGSSGFFTMWKGGTEDEAGGTAVVVVDHTATTINNAGFTITVVPEPATWALMGLGAPALALVARRRMRRDIT